MRYLNVLFAVCMLPACGGGHETDEKKVGLYHSYDVLKIANFPS